MAEIHSKKIDEKKFLNVIQKDFSIKGTLRFQESVLIKGTIQGTVDSRKQVVISKHAVVDGDIHASHLDVQGNINGNIFCTEDVRIEQKAKVIGDIQAANLNIEPGSFFEGRSVMKNNLVTTKPTVVSKNTES